MSKRAGALLLTRPVQAAERFLEEIRSELPAGTAIEISPLIEIAPLAPPLPPGEFRALVVTSAHGAHALTRLGLDPALPVWAVGPQSAEAARRAGFRARQGQGDADALLEELIERGGTGPFLHLRGEHARGRIAERLREAGREAADMIVYRQDARPLSDAARAMLDGEVPVALALFSPRSAALLARAGPFRAPLCIAAISAATAAETSPLTPRRTIIAPTPDGAGMQIAARALFVAAEDA